MIRAAGGLPHREIDAELKQIRHERLVHDDDEEVRAFRAEEVEFFRSLYGQHFKDGIAEIPNDLETLGFPALVRNAAYHSSRAIYDLEPANELVVQYRKSIPTICSQGAA